MKNIFIIIVVLLLPINTSAYTVKGYGAMDCGEMLDDFDDKFEFEDEVELDLSLNLNSSLTSNYISR